MTAPAADAGAWTVRYIFATAPPEPSWPVRIILADGHEVTADAGFEEQHPRGYHGRFGHGTGPARRGEAPVLIGRRVKFTDKGKVQEGTVQSHTPATNTTRSRGGRYDRMVIETDDGRRYTRDISTVKFLPAKASPARSAPGHAGELPAGYRLPEQITTWHDTEPDATAKQHLGRAAGAYVREDYEHATAELHEAARYSDRGHDYDVLADKIAADAGLLDAPHLAATINREADVAGQLNDPETAQVLRNAAQAIGQADTGAAAGYLRQAAETQRRGGEDLLAQRYDDLAAQVASLPAGPRLVPKYPGQYRDRLSSYWRSETDDEAKQALNQAGASYDDNQYDQPADLLRDAAGRVGPLGRTQDADKYRALADAIEQQGQDNGISHTTQALNAIGTETDATNYGDVADQLSNARRAITRAQPGTNWRVQAADYLRQAGIRAAAHSDYAAAHRYDNISSRVLKLPDTQAPGNAALAEMITRQAAAVPGLLGGGDQRFTGKIGTFTPDQQPDYLGFTYPDGHIELRTDVVNGLLDAKPGQVMPDPDNLDVALHEEIHDTTGGRTEQDKKDWAALSSTDQLTLERLGERDRGTGWPANRTLARMKSEAGPYITQAQVDSLTERGLLRRNEFTSVPPLGRAETDWQLTGKAARITPRDTSGPDDNEYSSITGHDAEEGFTELGATQHMEQFAKATGFGDVLTERLSVAPLTHVPPIGKFYEVQNDIEDLAAAAGKVGNPGTVNGPGSLEAYTSLLNARSELWAPHPRPAVPAEYLAEAYRVEPDPGVRSKIGALITRLGIKGGGGIDNPAWNKAQAELLTGMRAAQAALAKDGRPAQAQAARHLAGAITSVDSGFTSDEDIGAVLNEVQHLGDHDMYTAAVALHAKLDQLNATPAYKHDTLPEYAHWMADPAKLASRGSWGHYPILTASAQQWVQAAARAEHKSRVDQQGTAGYKRVVELTDEITREGAAGKLDAMARQVLRSMGIDPDTANPDIIAGIRNEISATFGDPSSAGHGGLAAWKAARHTGRLLTRALHEPAGGPPAAAAAADDEDDPGGVPPVTVTLTGPGAEADKIRAWAWQDPAARLAQATAQIRKLALATAGPTPAARLALRQVQAAGRSLATLAAIRSARGTVTADAGFESKHPRGYHGRFGHGDRPSDQQITDRLYHLFQAEQDPAARDAVQRAGQAYAGHDLPGAASALREAAGHAAEPGPYRDLAGHIEDRHAAQAAEPARAIAVAGPEAQATSAALDRALASGGEQATIPGAGLATGSDTRRLYGNTADTRIVTYADGSKWVRKRGSKLRPFTNEDVNHEIAYSRVARAFGVRAPVAIKHTGPDGKPEMYEPFVTGGIPAIEWTGGLDPAEGDEPGPGRDPARFYDSKEGRMIGLADSVAGTSERHLGNWMVVTDADGDHPEPVDNNDASFAPVFGSITPFADFDPHQLAAEHTAAEWAQWQRNLEALRPELTQLGMDEQWRNVMGNYREAKRQAGIT